MCFQVFAGEALGDADGEAAAEPDAAADDAAADADADGDMTGDGDGVGFSVTSTVTTGVGAGGVGLHAAISTANNNTAMTAKTIFLFIEKIRLLLRLIFYNAKPSMMTVFSLREEIRLRSIESCGTILISALTLIPSP